MNSVPPIVVPGGGSDEPSDWHFQLIEALLAAIGCASWVPFVRFLIAGAAVVTLVTAALVVAHLAGVSLPMLGTG